MRIRFESFFPKWWFLALFAFYNTDCYAQTLELNKEWLAKARSHETKAIASQDTALLAHAYLLFGKTYSFGGQNEQGKRYYVKALKLLENRPDSYDLGYAYVRICEFNSVKADSREDINYLKKAIGIFERIGSDQGLAMAYGMLQGAYGWRMIGLVGSHPEVVDSLRNLAGIERKFAEMAKDSAFIVDALVRSAFIDLQPGGVKRSLDLLTEAVRIADQTGNDTTRIRALLGLADHFKQTGQRDSLRRYLAKAQKIYNDNGYQQFFMLRHLMGVELEYYKLKEDWKKAYQALEAYQGLLNAYVVTEQDQSTNMMIRELEAEKSEVALLAHKRELELNNQLVSGQKKFIIFIGSLLVIMVVVFVQFFRLYRKNKRISQNNEHLLREQNHRVKNNLQMVSSLLSMQARTLSDSDARRAVEESRLRVQSMALIQRRLYDESGVPEINLAEFIPQLTENVLMACGFGDIRLEMDIEPVSLDVDKAIPIGLILTELITNCCKYAFPDNAYPELSIHCYTHQNNVVISVRDNGPGMDLSSGVSERGNTMVKKKDSFGMHLIALQVKQLFGSFKFTTAEGTKFEMEFSK